jgi:LPS export ABC transporter protein LptC/lipopolysaccharide transport protein LptA
LRKFARIAIAAFGVVFTAFVALQFKRPTAGTTRPDVVRSDPKAVIESTSGSSKRITGTREDVDVRFKTASTYGDGSTKFTGVTITAADRNKAGRTFTITANEGQAGQDDSIVLLDGNVQMQASDGMTARTQHATYRKADGSVDATGPVEFSRGRFTGTGIGLRFDHARDFVNIVSQAVIHVAPDEQGAGGAEITANSASFGRQTHSLQLDGNVSIQRGAQRIEADAAVGQLSEDEKRVEKLELHNHSRISTSGAAPGSLEWLSGADMALHYAPDGLALQRVLIFDEANVRMAGDAGKPGRQITSRTLDITLAADGSTPTALQARENVVLVIPPDGTTPERQINAAALDAKGEAGRGLTRASFTGGIQFRERGGKADRAASSQTLDTVMKPGMGTIEEARFAHRVRFEEGSMVATAAASRYDPVKGTLELSGSEAGFVAPHLDTEQIAVGATRIDVVLEGPIIDARGAVKSTMLPAKKDAKGESKTKLPSMLKQDKEVSVLGSSLAYDGNKSLATYTGNALLFQGDTSVKGDVITIDEQNGDLTASGKAMTTTTREQVRDKKTERVVSTGTGKDVKYEDAARRLTYTGNAHLVGPEGDMSATKIELYLKEDGEEVQRAEAYADAADKMTLKETHRTTTGNRMSYDADKETYIVKGLPATVLDECGRETIGTTLTFVKATDTIVVDGNQIRTQTKGGNGKCQSH